MHDSSDLTLSQSSLVSQPSRPLAQYCPVDLHTYHIFGPRVEGYRDLEPRQRFLQFRREIPKFSIFRPDESDGTGAELMVGHGHHHGFVDALQAAEDLFYLLGLDVL